MVANGKFLTFIISLSMLVFSAHYGSAGGREGLLPYLDPNLPLNVRVNDLVSRMTLNEKISQLGSTSPAIERLGVSAYQYWNEALHGVVATGVTSFPQSLALSSTWDPDLVYLVASAISDEARVTGRLKGYGLTYWCPVINMARDPRWGRTEETYGEDPCLAAKLAVQYIRGMQGSDPKYLKTVATVKHFACNNVDNDRHWTSSDVDERSLMEYYLPAFRECIEHSGVYSVMSAYNALNGVPCPANRRLLTNLLRKEWGFEGFVVSDCDAVNDVFANHKYVLTAADATALSLKNGTDLNCGETYQFFANTALQNGLMGTADIDTAVTRIFRARFLLGEFDPPGLVPYSTIPDSVVDCTQHRNLALLAAEKSIVLLKNQGGILPLNRDSLNRIAVIGPNADWVQLGGYSGVPVVWDTPLHAIINKFSGPGKTVDYAPGCLLYGPADTAALNYAVNVAKNADIAILFCGTDLAWTHEEKDRTSLDLPGIQDTLIQRVVEANPNTILVLVTGVPFALHQISESVPGIISAWYNGQAQGSAVTNVMFGDCNPGGKLTSTWYASVDDLPPFDRYDIKENRTYQYFSGVPLYPFGHGLSYTTFGYDSLSKSTPVFNFGDSLVISADIRNTGPVAGDEVVQFYIRHVTPAFSRPMKELKGFRRITLQPGEAEKVNFTLNYDALSWYDEVSKSFLVEEGEVELMVGSSSADIRLVDRVQVHGAVSKLAYRINPLNRIEAEEFDTKSNPLEIVNSTTGGQSIRVVDNNDVVEFKNVDFGEGVGMFEAMILLGADAGSDGALELRLDRPDGPVCGIMPLNSPGPPAGYQNYSCSIHGAAGVRNLFLHFINAGQGFCKMDWFRFGNTDNVEERAEELLKVYPNPASTHFWLDAGNRSIAGATIEISNLSGVTLWSGTPESAFDGEGRLLVSIPGAGFKPGIYLVKFTHHRQCRTYKLCIVP